ncbi:MAG: LPS export ABC transporter periplasmic protein LptC [Elusimicrobiales bacterium]|nr:LPS export ABC transporter periplasmic protein LptC [Elusimicrobiales bacterium]
MLLRFAQISLLLLAPLGACSRSGPAADFPTGAGLITGLRVTERETSDPKWSLESQAARLNEETGILSFASPRIIFFETGAAASVITSGEGELDMATQDARLEKGVLVDSRAEGMTLATETLRFSAAENKILSDDEVLITRGRTRIKGRGFRANPDLSRIELKQQETTLLPEDG